MSPPDPLLARVRWANVARAAALVAVVALVAAWPQLRAEAPALPDAEARPVPVAPAVAPPETTPAAEFGVESAAPDPEPGVRARRRRTKKRRPRPRPVVRRAPAPWPAPVVRRAPPPRRAPARPRAIPQAEREFGGFG